MKALLVVAVLVLVTAACRTATTPVENNNPDPTPEVVDSNEQRAYSLLIDGMD